MLRQQTEAAGLHNDKAVNKKRITAVGKSKIIQQQWLITGIVQFNPLRLTLLGQEHDLVDAQTALRCGYNHCRGHRIVRSPLIGSRIKFGAYRIASGFAEDMIKGMQECITGTPNALYLRLVENPFPGIIRSAAVFIVKY